LMCQKDNPGIRVDGVKFLRWQNKEMAIQEAFPELSADDREMLISGTCPACWEKMFPAEEEEEEE